MPSGSRRCRTAAVDPPRRSTRSAVLNAHGKREASDSWSQWRGERRSSRLGAPPETQLDPLPKRARTEESTVSSTSAGAPSVGASGTSYGEDGGMKIKTREAAAVKSTEVALEQVEGKKRGKYWFYARYREPPSGGAWDECRNQIMTKRQLDMQCTCTWWFVVHMVVCRSRSVR
jgi:hypothetical protein